MKVEIKKIQANQTYDLRHALLRKGQPRSACRLELDEDSKSLHLGAYEKELLVGVLSAMPTSYPEHKNYRGIQFRAIAVHPNFQRKGIASQLIKQAFVILDTQYKPHHIWLNARIAAQALYITNGFTPIGTTFDIPPIGIHQRFLKVISHES
jgi:ribosomal protein S18 acetylase RimI-like enzyme